MLTPKQLAAIKERQSNSSPEAILFLNPDRVIKYMKTDIDTLLDELERLHLALQIKDSALAQFSDAGNWGTVAMYNSDNEAVDLLGYAWLSYSPITLANQALMAGHEQ